MTRRSPLRGLDAAPIPLVEPLDITGFSPRAEPAEVDLDAVAASRAAARDLDFKMGEPAVADGPKPRLRAVPDRQKPSAPASAEAPERAGARRRVNMREVLGGTQASLPGVESVQYNALAPVPLVLRLEEHAHTHRAKRWQLLAVLSDYLDSLGPEEVGPLILQAVEKLRE